MPGPHDDGPPPALFQHPHSKLLRATVPQHLTLAYLGPFSDVKTEAKIDQQMTRTCPPPEHRKRCPEATQSEHFSVRISNQKTDCAMKAQIDDKTLQNRTCSRLLGLLAQDIPHGSQVGSHPSSKRPLRGHVELGWNIPGTCWKPVWNLLLEPTMEHAWSISRDSHWNISGAFVDTSTVSSKSAV